MSRTGLVSLQVGSTERPRRGATLGSDATWSCEWAEDGPGPVSSGAPAGRSPDLTLRVAPEDAQLVLTGELAPSVAFMQGRLKTAGDNELLLRVLEWSNGPAWAEALGSWAGGPAGTAGPG